MWESLSLALAALVVVASFGMVLAARRQAARDRLTAAALDALIQAGSGHGDRATLVARLLAQLHSLFEPRASLAYVETPGAGLTLIEAAGVEDFRLLSRAPYTDPVIAGALEHPDGVVIGPAGTSEFWRALERAHGATTIAAVRLGAPRSAEGLLLLAFGPAHRARAAAPTLILIARHGWRLLADARAGAEQNRRIGRLLDELQDHDVIARSSAHDIGNHLGVITADLQRLGRAAAPETPEGRSLVKLDRELDVVRDMLRDVFEPDRAIETEPLEARSLVRAAQGLIAGRRGRAVEVVVEEPAGALTVQGNEVALLRIFGNLIHNALRHNPVSRPLTITLSARVFDEDAQFFVADDGRGIPFEDQAHLFEPGWTRSVEGGANGSPPDRRHGLGLWSTRRLVESLGGEIGVVSRPNEGAAFWFTIPRAGPASAPEVGRSRGGAVAARVLE